MGNHLRDQIIRKHLSKMGRKGGRAKYKGMPFRERSEIMKAVRAVGVAKQKAAKDGNGEG